MRTPSWAGCHPCCQPFNLAYEGEHAEHSTMLALDNGRDQANALKKRGVAVAAIDSSQSRELWVDTCDRLSRDELKLL